MKGHAARITPMKLSGRAGVLVQTPYDEHFLEQLKAMVPYTDRWYNNHRRGWWVAEAHSSLAEHLVRECFGAVTVDTGEGEPVTLTRAGERLSQASLALDE